jgi:hypothetical protein
MSPTDKQTIMTLAQFIKIIIVPLIETYQDAYPVLGAEGDTFFVEVAEGPMASRELLTTIYLEFGTVHSLPELDPESKSKEVWITITDASMVIATIQLVQAGLGKPAILLHPLDGNGDFLKGWSEAVTLLEVAKPVQPLWNGITTAN